MKKQKGKIKVLFVDDDIYEDEISKKSSKIMELEKNKDILVDVVVDGTAALEYLRVQKPDVIVLDIMMAPGLKLTMEETKEGRETGFVILRKIRKELKLDTPVIILTVYPKLLPESERQDLKVNEYIAKPIKMAKLADCIRFHAKGVNLL